MLWKGGTTWAGQRMYHALNHGSASLMYHHDLSPPQEVCISVLRDMYRHVLYLTSYPDGDAEGESAMPEPIPFCVLGVFGSSGRRFGLASV